MARGHLGVGTEESARPSSQRRRARCKSSIARASLSIPPLSVAIAGAAIWLHESGGAGCNGWKESDATAPPLVDLRLGLPDRGGGRTIGGREAAEGVTAGGCHAVHAGGDDAIKPGAIVAQEGGNSDETVVAHTRGGETGADMQCDGFPAAFGQPCDAETRALLFRVTTRDAAGEATETRVLVGRDSHISGGAGEAQCRI